MGAFSKLPKGVIRSCGDPKWEGEEEIWILKAATIHMKQNL